MEGVGREENRIEGKRMALKGRGREGRGEEKREKREEKDANSEGNYVSVWPVEYQAAIQMMLTQHIY